MTDTEDTIDISGLDKAAVLAALYNAASPQGLGFLHWSPEPMTLMQAAELIADRSERLYFDYVQGRPLKVNLSADTFSPRLYDRDQGEGKAAAAIAALRETDTAKTQALMELALAETKTRAREVEAELSEKSEWNPGAAVPVLTLRAGDYEEMLRPALGRVFSVEEPTE